MSSPLGLEIGGRRRRRSGAGRVYFKYNPLGNLSSDPGFGGTFTNASANGVPSYVDSSGIVRFVNTNTIRDAHYVGGVQTALLEGSRTNLCLRSEAMASAPWVTAGTAPTEAFASAAGLSFTRFNGTTSDYQVVTFTGNGTKCYAIYYRQDGSATGNVFSYIFDNTAATTRGSLTATIAANGTITAVAGNGATLLRTDSLASGVYRFLVQVPGIIAANVNRLYVTDTGAGTTAPQYQAAGMQAEDAAFPSSYIPTAASAVTRAADSLFFPANYAEQALTMYVKYVELGTQVGNTGNAIMSLGDVVTKPFLAFYDSSATQLIGTFNNGSASKNSGLLTTGAAYGDTVEGRVAFPADATFTINSSLNGAAEVSSTAATTQALGSGWGGSKLWVGDYDGSHQGFLAIQSVKVIAGSQTMATCRAA